MLKICVVGTGYVGLVSGACLAHLGHHVTCIDSDRAKVEQLRRGRIAIYEPGLNAIVAQNTAEHRLDFTDDLSASMGAATLVLFICLPTPTGPDGATADLAVLFSAVEDAARARRAAGPAGFVVFAIKSTVPLGTCRKLEAVIARHLPTDAFAVASNPEFLREGSAVNDFMKPDRIVVGSRSTEAMGHMRAIYAPLVRQGCRLFETSSLESSEIIKYAANIFLATKIGLINEFALLCERSGADVEELAAGIGLDPRIGTAGLRPGPGFGGSCFPKDLRALEASAERLHLPMPIVRAVIASNERQKGIMAERIRLAFEGNLRDVRIAILGLSFKAGTDDMRESPALTLIADLVTAGAIVTAFDPVAGGNARKLMPALTMAPTAEDALTGADAAVIATEWPEFATLDWQALGKRMVGSLVFDLRNILDGPALARMGLRYVGLGKAAPLVDVPDLEAEGLQGLASHTVPEGTGAPHGLVPAPI